MNIELFREKCLAMPEATEDMPFGDDYVVFRLRGKIFACFDLTKPNLVVMKCDAVQALEWRAQYLAVEGAWHWNKKYWNQIHLDGSVSDEMIEEMIQHAYGEIRKKVKNKQ